MGDIKTGKMADESLKELNCKILGAEKQGGHPIHTIQYNTRSNSNKKT